MGLTSLLQHMPEFKMKRVTTYLNNPSKLEDEKERTLLLTALDEYNLNIVPSFRDLKSILEDVAITEVVFRPMCSLSSIKKGLMSYEMLWKGMTPTLLQDLIKSLTPTPEKILESVEYHYAETPELCMLERVKGYLESFIAFLSPEQMQDFQKFVTAQEYMLAEKIQVHFNSTIGESRRPIAMTCTNSLSVSRVYAFKVEFKKNMETFIFSETSQVFDAV